MPPRSWPSARRARRSRGWTPDWDTRGGEVVNDEIQSALGARSARRAAERFRTQPGELRGYLTVVPEARWVKHPDAHGVSPRARRSPTTGTTRRTWRRSSLRPGDDARRAARGGRGRARGVDPTSADGGDRSSSPATSRSPSCSRPDGRRPSSGSTRPSPRPRAARPTRTPSTRGPEWVRFTPAILDGHAADRAVAWLGSAARRALGLTGRRKPFPSSGRSRVRSSEASRAKLARSSRGVSKPHLASIMSRRPSISTIAIRWLFARETRVRSPRARPRISEPLSVAHESGSGEVERAHRRSRRPASACRAW